MSEDQRKPTVGEVEEFMLQKIDAGMSPQLGWGSYGVVREVQERYPGIIKPSPRLVAEALWNLIGRGLVFLDFTSDSGSAPVGSGTHSWWIAKTENGRKATSDTLPNPDLPEKYLQEFASGIPGVSETVLRYVNEALNAYGGRLYMACAVMIGVAAEGAFLEMADAFCKWLQGSEAEKFSKTVTDPRTSYNTLLKDFQKFVQPRRKELPAILSDNLDVEMNSILSMIRKYRNEAGHPTGVTTDRGACFLSLVSFAEAAKRVYALKTFFNDNSDKRGE